MLVFYHFGRPCRLPEVLLLSNQLKLTIMIDLEKKTTTKKVTIRRKISDFATSTQGGVSVIDVNALFASLRPEVIKAEIRKVRG